MQDRLDLLGRERREHKHLGPRQQRGVHLERRVLRRRADEDDIAGFDAWEERVLLGFVEAVNLIDEQNGPAREASPRRLGLGHDVTDLLDA